MAKKTKRSSNLPCMASYEGLCSRFTDLVGMKHTRPSAAWELHVVRSTISILKFRRPDLLEEVKKAVKEEYEELGKRFPKEVSEEGTTYRCTACNKVR